MVDPRDERNKWGWSPHIMEVTYSQAWCKEDFWCEYWVVSQVMLLVMDCQRRNKIKRGRKWLERTWMWEGTWGVNGLGCGVGDPTVTVTLRAWWSNDKLLKNHGCVSYLGQTRQGQDRGLMWEEVSGYGGGLTVLQLSKDALGGLSSLPPQKSPVLRLLLLNRPGGDCLRLSGVILGATRR